MAQGKKNNQREDEKLDSRWWEFYLVRYFVGTIVGALIILFLANSKSPLIGYQVQFPPELTNFASAAASVLNVTVLAAAGFAFCYIASSPILVFHATRGLLFSKQSGQNRTASSIVFLVVLTVLLVGIQVIPLWYKFGLQSVQFFIGTVVLFLISVVFLFQVFFLILSLNGRNETAFKYYDNLVTKRANADDRKRQYIESYRHLREHGNAFFILFLEFLLGGALFYAPVPWMIVLVIWILPAVGVWFFGNVLESRDF